MPWNQEGVLSAQVPPRLGPLVNTSISDLNLMVETGFYFTEAATANAPLNGQAFQVEVIANTPDYMTQTATMFLYAAGGSDSWAWRRFKYGATWSAWFRIRVDEVELDNRYVKRPSNAAADRLPYYFGPNSTAVTPFTAYARTLVGRANSAQVRNDLDVYSKAEAASIQGGTEMGYAERTSDWTTTNTTLFATTAASRVTGLSVGVTGEGRPVDLEFACNARHASANAVLGFWFNSNNQNSSNPGGYIGFQDLNSGNINQYFYMKNRVILPAGSYFTFTVGVYVANASGTVTLMCNPTYPAWLSVTRR